MGCASLSLGGVDLCGDFSPIHEVDLATCNNGFTLFKPLHDFNLFTKDSSGNNFTYSCRAVST